VSRRSPEPLRLLGAKPVHEPAGRQFASSYVIGRSFATGRFRVQTSEIAILSVFSVSHTSSRSTHP
jgi:hypothetical protein